MKFDKCAKWLVDHAPAIFTGLAMVGTITTTALAVEATPAAMDCMEAAYLEKGDKLDKKEVVKATWKCYIPAAVSGGLTIGCIVAANYAHIRKETAMAAMASFFEKRYLDYKDKVIELDGPDKDKEIEVDLAKDHLTKNPPSKAVIRSDEILCYEPNTKQTFISNKTEMMWAELTANKILSMEERVTLNQILALFPDADHNKEEGKHIGWWLDDSYYEFIGYNWGFYGRPWLDFDPVYEEINGQRTCIIHFTVEPVHEEAYDVEEMLETKARIEDELSIKHISDEIDQIQKQSQK